MNGINKVFILGHLGRDPESVTAKSGANYTKLNVGTNRGWKDENGLWNDRTEWHRVIVWGRSAEVCATMLKKGSPVMVEGHISNFEIKDENDKPVWKTRITAENVQFLKPQTQSP